MHNALKVRYRKFVQFLGLRPDRLHTETVDLSGISADDKVKLCDELYPAHRQIFAGLDKEAFYKYVFCSGADLTKIRLYRQQDETIVGYAAVHRYRSSVLGKNVTIFRAEAGLTTRYRAHGRTYFFYTRQLARFRLRHPFETIYYLGMLVHPSSYVAFARYFQTIYPRCGHEIPSDIRQLMIAAAEIFGIPPVDPGDPLIRNVGWSTRQSRPFWEKTKDPDIVYFRERNPGYPQGHGLLVLVPITFKNLLNSFPINIKSHVDRRIHHHRD